MKKYVSYKNLSKDEKKSALDKFNKSKKGSELSSIYTRLLVEGVGALLFAIGLAIYTFVTTSSWWYYLVSGILFVFGIILLVAEYSLKRKVVEQMLNK